MAHTPVVAFPLLDASEHPAPTKNREGQEDYEQASASGSDALHGGYNREDGRIKKMAENRFAKGGTLAIRGSMGHESNDL